MTNDQTQSFDDRRSQERHALKLDVNYRHGDTYLFCRSGNLSEMGIFLVTEKPLLVGTEIELRFDLPGGAEVVELLGEVMWVQHNREDSQPGMGVRFINPEPESKARIRSLIRTIAYLE